MPVVIKSVDVGSPAARHGIVSGERLISINEHIINDVLDYRFYETDRSVRLVLEDAEGNSRIVSITKPEYRTLGLEFETYLMDKQRSCKNKCVFCFIDQLPKGLRDTLYFKDDDERLSFLFGNYITLTNLSEEELDRIIEMHISPVNVSVHVTDPEMRVKMMKNPCAAELMPRLQRLVSGGVMINCQLVLCPGWNDGEYLRRSLEELAAMRPQVQSIALVPVGLTEHREGLEELRLFTKEEASAVVDMAEEYSEKWKKENGSRIVWASDEFYLTAGREIPPAEFYEEYPQIENGVGMVASLEDEFARAMRMYDGDDLPHSGVMVSGVSIAPTLERLIERAKEKWKNGEWKVYPIRNRLFGENITVSGLVCGGDIIEQMKGEGVAGERMLFPTSMLRSEGDLFLDDRSVKDVEEALGVEMIPVDNDGYALLEAMLGQI